MTGAVMPPSWPAVQKLIDGKDVPAASSKGKAGKNNKGKVAEATPATITEAATPEPAAQEPAEKPLIVLTDVPASASSQARSAQEDGTYGRCCSPGSGTG